MDLDWKQHIDPDEEIAWVCNECEAHGPYKKSNYTFPKGWKDFGRQGGLKCKLCSDVQAKRIKDGG